MTTTKPGSADGRRRSPAPNPSTSRSSARGPPAVTRAATLARGGYDVVVVERKDESEAGHIACGDAPQGSQQLPRRHPEIADRDAFTNTDVDHGRFEIPQEDTVLEIPVPGELAVIDRWEYGLPPHRGGAAKTGVEFHYDTVVQDVVQDDGTVTGLSAVRKGDPVTYEADVVVDAAGSLSLLQDKVDFDGTTFDTNVTYSAVLLGLPRNRRDRGAGAVGRRARVQAHRPRRGLPLVLPAHGHGDKRRPRLPDERGADGTRRRPQRGS